MKYLILFSFPAALILTGCGGSSTSSGSSIITEPQTFDLDIPDFNSASAAEDESFEMLDRLSPLGFTAPEDFQRSGTASFTGSLIVEDLTSTTAAADVYGGFQLIIDFGDADKVTGVAGEFYDVANTKVGGTLELENVVFDEGTAGGGLVGDMRGRLTNVGPSGVDADYDYDVELGVIYYGDGVQGMLALGGGTATPVGSGSSREVVGAGVLERD